MTKQKSSFCKTVYNIGYIGEGKYKPTEVIQGTKKDTIQYKYWKSMMVRCYSKKYHIKQPTYIDCEVYEEWLCFQTFAKWFDENYYECDDGKMCLDKDILYKGNKIYSPNTCVFVPDRINKLFTKNNVNRGNLPIGVTYNEKTQKFRAMCSIYINGTKKLKHIGRYNDSNQAFYEGYKPFKEDYIKEVAEEYKYKIPKNLYEAMYRYVVEIDD